MSYPSIASSPIDTDLSDGTDREPTTRASVTLTVVQKLAAEERARTEGRRSLSDLIAEAVRLYLLGPIKHVRDDALRDAMSATDPVPSKTLPRSPTPGDAADRYIAAETGRLRQEVAALLTELRPLVPLLAEAATGYQELQEQIDDITVAIGRRRGAALALQDA